jgi:sterol desaturase/sphingolipid hydroxylase (fatty acid hydroxylase superfamily)
MLNADTPFGIKRRLQAQIARRRLYPVSVLYTVYACAVLAAALRRGRPATALAFFAAGAVAWTLMEYLVHRHILHGRFPDGPGLLQHFLHKSFDHLHWEHHARPWDGRHVNGTIKDTGPFALVLAGLSFLAPLDTAPVFMAGLLQSYILEEWVHHSVHFCRFRNPYFRYIKRHHLYHHSPKGSEAGYGLTNGFWDIVLRTRFPAQVRRTLYARGTRRAA